MTWDQTIPDPAVFGAGRRVSMPEQTEELAARAATLLRGGESLLLFGPLGAGKTRFVQGLCRELGVTEAVTSPTFTLVRSYDIDQGPFAGKLTLHHADLYRLERTTEVADLALAELAEFRGIVLVEGGARVAASLLAERRTVRVIHGHGTGQLRRALAEFLRMHALVARFTAAPPEQGGSGVTVVDLKE